MNKYTDPNEIPDHFENPLVFRIQVSCLKESATAIAIKGIITIE